MVRLVKTALEIEFDVFDNQEEILREFDIFSQIDDDPISSWLKLAKAKGEVNSENEILLKLIVELHKKIDLLSSYIKNEQNPLVSLGKKAYIDAIGFENFHLKDEILEKKIKYYGRISLPVFPKREIPVFFEKENDLAKIEKLHQKDRSDWNSYFMARERIMIRQLKEKNDS